MGRDVSGEPRRPKGDSRGGEWTRAGGGVLSERAKRALATHKPSTLDKQRLAAKAVIRVNGIVGGSITEGNQPMDIIARAGSKKVGIEVKSITSNGNDKITMHPDSLMRKFEWTRKNRADGHTVVVDMKSGVIYHREEFGSFRLHTMTVVKNNAHLRRLLGIDS